MSGAGGGFEDLRLSNGNLSIALLQYSNAYVQSAVAGYPSKQALDLRLRNFRLSQNNSLLLWFAEGYTNSGSGIDTSSGTPLAVNYAATSGSAVGIRWRYDLFEGFNDFAVIYGNSVMESLTLNADAYSGVAANLNLNNTNRWRVVETLTKELSSKWAIHYALIYENLNRSLGSYTRWSSIGARPVYYFTDHIHLLVEGGFSDFLDSAETNSTGSNPGERTLARISIAPEIAIGRGFYQRPTVRAYISYSMWNDANKDLSNTHSLVSVENAQGLPALNGKNNQAEVGFEGEVWF
jgi:maltoporin